MTLTEPAQDHRPLHQCVAPGCPCSYCPKCGMCVEHEEIPDDTHHCPCRRNRTNGPCSCPCHMTGVPV